MQWQYSVNKISFQVNSMTGTSSLNKNPKAVLQPKHCALSCLIQRASDVSLLLLFTFYTWGNRFKEVTVLRAELEFQPKQRGTKATMSNGNHSSPTSRTKPCDYFLIKDSVYFFFFFFNVRGFLSSLGSNKQSQGRWSICCAESALKLLHVGQPRLINRNSQASLCLFKSV